MRIAVLMSGGVDSSVAAHILKSEGHEVFGIHMVHLDEPSKKAMEVSERLGIDLKVLDVRKDFRRKVLDYFLEEYRDGRTPNPCYFCNRYIKFGILFEKAMELGADLVASGHYARVKDGKLFRAIDRRKDQSYFLSSLKRDTLERIVLPLGEMRKEEVLKIAEGIGIEPEEESQDVCFLRGNLRDFLRERGILREGRFVYKGKIVGRNPGYAAFTIGQRKGLGISFGKRVYVTKIDPKENIVFLGEKDDVMYDMMIVKELNFLDDVPEEFEADVKVRSNFDPVRARVLLKRERAEVVFEEKVFAVTPGQIAVFYSDDEVLMSGVIERGERS